jgi:hypothetical protein
MHPATDQSTIVAIQGGINLEPALDISQPSTLHPPGLPQFSRLHCSAEQLSLGVLPAAALTTVTSVAPGRRPIWP